MRRPNPSPKSCRGIPHRYGTTDRVSPRRRSLLIGALLLACAACRREAGQPVERDLVALFPYTDSGQDTVELDFGNAAAARHLLAGWSVPERAPTGESVVRAVARKAVVDLTLGAPADRVLSLRMAATRLPASRPPAVIVRFNGRRLATLELQSAMSEHRIALPARIQRRGANELTFNVRMGRGGERLEVVYDTLQVLSATGERRLLPHVNGDAIALPPHSEVSYFLRLPERPELHLGVDDGLSPRLLVRVQRDGELARSVVAGRDGVAPSDMGIAAWSGEVVRLAFANEGDTPVRLLRPRVRGADRVGAAQPAGNRTGPRHNVILYMIDTLRADHLGCYGYRRPTSPRIDAFGREGVIFDHAVAQSSWTRPSAASILTGHYPAAHGATTLRRGLRPEVATLAEILQGRGYRTGAFVTNVNVAPQWGFQRGFELYRYLPEDEKSATVHVGADVVNTHAFEWLAATGEPFFLYLHVTDPHLPYAPPDPWRERLADRTVAVDSTRVDDLIAAFRERQVQPTEDEVRALAARYDGEIAFVDESFGQLLDELRRRGLYDRTAIVLIADHGEEFGDHGGFEHGRTLYEEIVHVPFIARLPGASAAGTRVATTVQQVDVLATLLDYLAIPVPAGLAGRSLVPALAGHALAPADALAETSLSRPTAEAVITGTWKVIRKEMAGPQQAEVYDFGVDPKERDNRARDKTVLLGYARQALVAAVGNIPAIQPQGEPAVDPAIMERLRALGYTE